MTLRDRVIAQLKDMPDTYRELADNLIALVRRETLEEAAKVVHDNWQSGSCTYICAAIRALGEKP